MTQPRHFRRLDKLNAWQPCGTDVPRAKAPWRPRPRKIPKHWLWPSNIVLPDNLDVILEVMAGVDKLINVC